MGARCGAKSDEGTDGGRDQQASDPVRKAAYRTGPGSYIVQDMAVVRLQGVLMPAERHLAKDSNGSSLIREMRLRLVETSKDMLETWIKELTGCRVLSLLTDLSTKTGEHILVFVLDKNLEESFKDRQLGPEWAPDRGNSLSVK